MGDLPSVTLDTSVIDSVVPRAPARNSRTLYYCCKHCTELYSQTKPSDPGTLTLIPSGLLHAAAHVLTRSALRQL